MPLASTRTVSLVLMSPSTVIRLKLFATASVCSLVGCPSASGYIGSLSSFLDNAPTYLTFLALAQGSLGAGQAVLTVIAVFFATIASPPWVSSITSTM